MLGIATEDASPQHVCADGELPVPRVSRLLDEQGASLRRELQAFLVCCLEEHKTTFLTKLQEEYQKMEADAAGGLGEAVSAEQVAPMTKVSSSLSNVAVTGTLAGSNARLSPRSDRPELEVDMAQAPWNSSKRSCLACGDIGCSLCQVKNLEDNEEPQIGQHGFLAAAKSITRDAVLRGLGHQKPAARDPNELLKSLQNIKGAGKNSGHLSEANPESSGPKCLAHHVSKLQRRMTASFEGSNTNNLSASEGKLYKSAALRELAGQNHEKGSTPFQQFVRSSRFELMTGGLILACAVIMAFQIEYQGFSRGFNLKAPFFPLPSEAVWPVWAGCFAALEVFFCLAFTVELAVRIFGWHWLILFSGWFWLDLVLVVFAWLDWFSMVQVPIDPMLLRLARLARVARLVKLLKAMKAFDTLVLLIRSVQASLGALVWSFFLILVLQFCAAIILCQLLKDYMEDEDNPEDIRAEVFHYFGTFSGTMLTMFEISVGNWIVPCRILYGKVSRLWGLFFILFRCCGIDAMMKVITAVFIAETSRCVSLDDNVTIQKRAKETQVYIRKLEEIFLELDDSGDGILSWDEFQQILSDDLLKHWLATLNIDTHDLGQLFVILAEDSDQKDDGCPRVDIKKFTRGMSRVKGPATAIDVLKLQDKCEKLERGLNTLVSMSRSQALPAVDEKPRAAFVSSPRSNAESDFVVKAVSNMSQKLDQLTLEIGSAAAGPSRSIVASTLFSTNGSLAMRPHDVFSERPEEPDMLRVRIRELEHEVRAAWQLSGRAALVPAMSGQTAAGGRHAVSDSELTSGAVPRGPRSRGPSDFDSIAPTARSSPTRLRSSSGTAGL